MDVDAIIKEIKGVTDPARKEALWKTDLRYDSSSEQLEPIYYWILDFMKETSGLKVEKLIDNFAASVGGGFFSELGAKATKMQEEAMKILAQVNAVLKSIINLLYDLKEFETRLQIYDDYKDEKKKDAALLALKQVWMDKVDMQRGRGSINAMAYELNFTTLRDAFMTVKSTEDIKKMDINERVKRVLKPRLAEFFQWLGRSEKELRTRFSLEKNYLRSQVNSLKLYTKWVKPYLKSAEQLRMKEHSLTDPDMVNAFNTIVLELLILGKKEITAPELIGMEFLPKSMYSYKPRRKYYACVIINFKFRGIPSRTPQGHFVFGGKAEITSKAFTMNDDELKIFNKRIQEDEWKDVLKLVQGITDESLEQLSKDVEHFLGKEDDESKEEVGFLGLAPISSGSNKNKDKKSKKEKKKKELELKKIKKDNHEESLIRNGAEVIAVDTCFDIYDKYKDTHGMAGFEGPDFFTDPEWQRSFSSNWK